MQNRVAAQFHAPGAHLSACDVVLANILAGPLITLAPLLAAATQPAGRIVLSGILESQADEVRAAYEPWFDIAAPIADEGWVLLAGPKVMP
jgi:ribosomal protein L11 methyltransferase